VAVVLGGRLERHRVVAAVARQPRIGIGIGDAPVNHLALGIVGARQAPWPGGALLDRHVGPGIAAGLARRRGHVEPPGFLAGLGVMGGDEAVLALALGAGAVGDHLAVGDENPARGLAAVVDLGLPAEFSGLRI